MKMTTIPGLMANGVLISLALASTTVLANADCSTERIQSIAPEGTVIDSAAPTAVPTPHCKIDGHIITTNPGPNRVNFRLQLPDEGWQNRYFFIGMGGAAGSVPTYAGVPAGSPMFKGFAVAGTDTGRQGHMLDWSFLRGNPAQTEDHIHRAMHVTAVATQALTKTYYESDTLHRYMSGCSGGGRMATESITRHPEDFDGVLLGAPGGRSSATMMAFIYNAQQMTREPGAWLSPEKLQMLEKKVIAQCDELDGAKDNIIADNRACSFDFDALKCAAGDNPACLTEPELKSVKAVLAGPQGPKGPITVGYPIANISFWSDYLGRVPPPWSDEATMENIPKTSTGYVIGSSMAKVLFGPDFNALSDFDFNDQEDIDGWWREVNKIGYGKPNSSDLRGLQKAGGKVLMWNGVSDPCCSDIQLEEYYEEAGEAVGGMDKLQEFARFYRVPGLAHCVGGVGPQDAVDQFLEAMIGWVEKDIPPGDLIAHRGEDRLELIFADPATGKPAGNEVPPAVGEPRDFLLCPHPQVAKFNAKDPEAVTEAKNWQCSTL
ncbi:MAG: tannase/feruloyl esterase family alpha/beta hydrolase [Porticoccaceae bacterium]